MSLKEEEARGTFLANHREDLEARLDRARISARDARARAEAADRQANTHREAIKAWKEATK